MSRYEVVCPSGPPQTPTGPKQQPGSHTATQPAASEPGPSTPQPAKRTKRTEAEQRVDRDCNVALNMQRIGESKWRPLELCYWPEQGKLPAKGKEYSGLGYKRLRDKPPKAQQQQQQEPAVAQ
ncbi:hypothetical protein QJQ45_011761 [Haematococcus lacustris]|nr:hypothetical protein QJQ45_011761 [Haematococcus lacustris]